MLLQKDKKGNIIDYNKPRIVGSSFCIRTNYIVRRNIWLSHKEKVKQPPRSTDKNLLDNSHTGEMSPQSQKKITSAINWLTTCARQKWIPECAEHKGFYFKVNFITLSLSANDGSITADNIHRLLLAPFLDYARKMWSMSAYVWKIELQANGNPHIHITTDTYIHWLKLRNYWNKLQSNLGLTQLYTAKYINCNFDFYLKNNPATDLVSIANRWEQWKHSSSIGFSSPNSTDVHSVKNIKDMPAYLCKYMAKNMSEVVQVRGLSALAAPTFTSRMWGCSAALSKAFKTTVDIYTGEQEEGDSCLYDGTFQIKQVLGKPDRAGIQHPIADIIFLKPHHWHGKIKGKFYRVFLQVKLSIQNEYRSPHVINMLAPPPVTAILN